MAKAIEDAADDPEQPRHIQAAAQAARERMNADGKVAAAYELLKEARRVEPEQFVPDEGATPPGTDWIPAPNEKSRAAVDRRRELIHELAPLGYSSEQIGERLGILPDTIRRLARAAGITIRADEAIRHTQRRIDSNRIIRETVQDLANTETALGLVKWDELDRAEVEGWITSLSKSIRVLNRLNKQLKEMIQ
jgi:hypothetical protein